MGLAVVGVAAVSGVSKRTKKFGHSATEMSRLMNILTSSASESKSLSSRESWALYMRKPRERRARGRRTGVVGVVCSAFRDSDS